MGESSHRPSACAAVLVSLLLAAACIGGGGDDPTSGAAPGLDTESRCDLGFNTVTFNDADAGVHHHPPEAHTAASPVDFTVRDWAEVFADESLGMTVGEVAAAVEADDIYHRHVLGGVLTHTLAADSWVPMTDRADCDALAAQLRQARAVAARYPTVADALAAGYVQGDTYYAGLGVHYQNYGLLGDFDASRPVQLLYDGTDADSALVGVSYVVHSPGGEPEGFVGDNDRWHLHRSFCLDAHAVNLSADVLSESECEALGGVFAPNDEQWMLHTWVAPGCESDWGVFSLANPRLPYLPGDATFAAGCNSGMTVADRLELDARGTGPEVD